MEVSLDISKITEAKRIRQVREGKFFTGVPGAGDALPAARGKISHGKP